MSTPLGDFIRAKRDSIQPASLGLPDRGRRRSPGLRRSDLATRAGISVEYLTRMEQGRDRNPSVAVVNALADALGLDPSERNHLRYLAKITGGECTAHAQPAPPRRDVRPTVLETLRLLEPGIAMVTNRLGDVLSSADTGADWRDWQPQGRSETTDDHTAPKASTVRATLTLPRLKPNATYRIGLSMPHPRFPGASDAVRCANATTRWVGGVNVLADLTPGS
ncbi:helix-turn-helix transcriptional regulator [Streptomyces sp. NPDC018352]|uniref:helix-turn-helix domain-containing protein n=1 Tax=Streptomyces sp. NPDC018352 TaxID=3157194 RepID=UPI0033C5B844